MAITARPDIVDHSWAIVIGAVGAGVWGTLAVCIAGDGNPVVQFTGIVAVGAFVFGVSLLVWRMIDVTLGARISARVEGHGQDFAELGIEAFPEFMLAEDDRRLP